MLNKLIELANALDLMGLEKEANDVDAVIRRIGKVFKFANSNEDNNDDAITFFEESLDASQDLREYPLIPEKENDRK